MKNKFYITTTLPYVNADPHIGFAAEIIRADVLARYHRRLGDNVFFNTGTDEHGLKIYTRAKEEKMNPQKYVDKFAVRFDSLKQSLNLSYDNFVRTTDPDHIKAAQEFWRLCEANNDIYKKNYKTKYCVGCESSKTDSELKGGKCPDHPNKKIEIIEEENYFFRWSNYQDKLLEFYKDNPDFIVPKHRQNEIKKFVARGLEDFSISRLKSKMPWGVPVPGDKKHVMYVWFDALTNYISALGWPGEKRKFNRFWGVLEKRNAVQVAGKDNLRFQTAMWQAMLMSAGLPLSKAVLIFGFINSGGKKMSKSLGNVINPFDLVEKYGADATRYYLLSEIRSFEDSDFTYEKFAIRYNADLANGLGNLVGRTVAMSDKLVRAGGKLKKTKYKYNFDYFSLMEGYKIDEALFEVWGLLRGIDKLISDKKPWEMIGKDNEKAGEILYICLEVLRLCAHYIWPFMPETAERIWPRLGLNPVKELGKDLKIALKWGGLPLNTRVKKADPLFPRLEN